MDCNGRRRHQHLHQHHQGQQPGLRQTSCRRWLRYKYLLYLCNITLLKALFVNNKMSVESYTLQVSVPTLVIIFEVAHHPHVRRDARQGGPDRVGDLLHQGLLRGGLGYFRIIKF